MKELFVGTAGILIGFIFVLYSALAYGFVTDVYYDWFIVSRFSSLPDITYLQFVGITLFLYALYPKYGVSFIKPEYENNTTKWLHFILGPWIMLLFGYLFYTFIY